MDDNRRRRAAAINMLIPSETACKGNRQSGNPKPIRTILCVQKLYYGRFLDKQQRVKVNW